MNYSKYHEQLFPGDPILIENPLSADASVDEIIAEVSRQTGIKAAWLQRSSREVMEGLAGLGCLWFLHGAHGTAKGKRELPHWVHGIVHYLSGGILSDPAEQRRGIESAYVHEGNYWGKGTTTFEKKYRDRKSVFQTIKIGKHIDAYADHEALTERTRLAMHHDLKWRAKADQYEWRISCHPYDILTMSHDRPWPSCMKPGGLFEFGPLTDMAAGSAIIWFTKPGAGAPCGRLILRPFVKFFPEGRQQLRPGISSGGRLYGEGPSITPKALNTMIGAHLKGLEVEEVKVCDLGERGLALTRGIYSDTDRYAGGCSQDLGVYGDAYENLGDTGWPEADFAVRDLARAARKRVEGMTYRGSTGGRIAEQAAADAEARLLAYAQENFLDWFLNGTCDEWTIYETIKSHENLTYNAGDMIDNILMNDHGSYIDIFEVRDAVLDSTIADLADEMKYQLTDHLKEAATIDFAILTFDDAAWEASGGLAEYSSLPFTWWGTPEEAMALGEEAILSAGDMVRDSNGVIVNEDTGAPIHVVVIVTSWVYEAHQDIGEHATSNDGVIDFSEIDTSPKGLGIDAWFEEL